MAISLDTSAVFAGDSTDVSSVTFSITVGAGSNHGLLVCTGQTDNDDTNRLVTGVTFNGVALTKLREQDNTTNNIAAGVWYLPACDEGTHDVVITAGGILAGLTGSAYSLFGASQSTTADANNGTSTSNAANASVDVTTVADNAWVFTACVMGGIAATITDNSTQDNELSDLNYNGTASDFASGTKGPNSPAGAVTGSWSDGVGGTTADWALCVVSIAPAVAATPTYPGYIGGGFF